MSPLDTIRSVGRPLAYYPAMAKHVGGVNAAIFLGQLMYWDERTENELGVYKSTEQWEEETGLSYREQSGARKKLRDLGLLIETNKRLQHRIYYKLNHEAFDELMESVLVAEKGVSPQSTKAQSPNDENAIGGQPKAQSPNDENAIGGQPKAQLADEQKRKSLIDTETTTETTTEIKEKTSKKTNANAFNFSKWPAVPDEDVWADYVKHRQRLKAPLTQTAVSRLGNEAHKAVNLGFPVDDFLAECMMRGWRGGKAEWLKQETQKGKSQAKHGNFAQQDYSAGVTEDGYF